AGNKVQGNFVGTDATGTTALGNSGGGVVLGFGTLGNMIGGEVAAARNVVSGNTGARIGLIDFVFGNFLEGNFVGTDVTGMADLGNSGAGVRIAGGALMNGFSGGLNHIDRNVISGNGGDGVLIRDEGTSGNQVMGNLIGPAADGISALPN